MLVSASFSLSDSEEEEEEEEDEDDEEESDESADLPGFPVGKGTAKSYSVRKVRRALLVGVAGSVKEFTWVSFAKFE